jgi:hypothetical protein
MREVRNACRISLGKYLARTATGRTRPWVASFKMGLTEMIVRLAEALN